MVGDDGLTSAARLALLMRIEAVLVDLPTWFVLELLLVDFLPDGERAAGFGGLNTSSPVRSSSLSAGNSVSPPVFDAASSILPLLGTGASV